MDDPTGSPAPVFAQPWEARTFAMVKTLQEQGLVSPAEWADALGEQIRCAADDQTASSFRPWLAALESIVTAKQLTSADALHRRRAAWERAAQRTPHGQPIVLDLLF